MSRWIAPIGRPNVWSWELLGSFGRSLYVVVGWLNCGLVPKNGHQKISPPNLLGCDIGGAKEPGVIYFPINWGAKEPQNLPNHRVVCCRCFFKGSLFFKGSVLVWCFGFWFFLGQRKGAKKQWVHDTFMKYTNWFLEMYEIVMCRFSCLVQSGNMMHSECIMSLSHLKFETSGFPWDFFPKQLCCGNPSIYCWLKVVLHLFTMVNHSWATVCFFPTTLSKSKQSLVSPVVLVQASASQAVGK